MRHKPQLVRVGKEVPDIIKRMRESALSPSMLDQVMDSEVRNCAWGACKEPEELHVQMCAICFEKEEDCGYSLSIKGIKL